MPANQFSKSILAYVGLFLALVLLFSPINIQAQGLDTLWIQDWEAGWGDWWVDGAQWQVGSASYGPPEAAYNGINCAGTVLNGTYTEPAYGAGTQTSRLISPVFVVPSDNPRLRFYHWYSFSWGDYGKVEIRVNGGSWVALTGNHMWTGGVWTRPAIDLSTYADSTVEIAFSIITQRPDYYDGSVAAGWYVDDIVLEHGEIVFNNPEDFESGLGNWRVEAGLWQVGKPTSGPNAAYSGDSCAGTVISGSYTEPPYGGSTKTSRLISPVFVVPPDNPRLRFYHWYSFSWSDYGKVEIRVNGGSWVALTGNHMWTSGVWTRPSIDLSAYADSTVEIAFSIITQRPDYYDGSVAAGWYVDDVIIEQGGIVFNNPEDFETGLGNWWVDAGLWQVGKPTSGPNAAYSGDSCAGTVLNGSYTEPPYGGGTKTSRLISPVFIVPSDNPRLRFYHWYSFSWSDYGKVEIRVNGGSWVALTGNHMWTSGVWTRPSIDLSAYADSTVEIAFSIVTQRPDYYDGSVAAGWYVDDVALEHGQIVFNNPEDFETGLGDWKVEAGLWQVGKPASGLNAAYSGDSCAGTVMSGSYTEPPYGGGTKTSRLISPVFVVPSDNPRLRFYHWYSFSWSDYGKIEIRVNGGSWAALTGNHTWTSGVWTRPSIDLSAYADSTVEIAFSIITQRPDYYDGSVSYGWYVDDVVLEHGQIVFNNPEDFESGLGDWKVEAGLWQVGKPTSGPNAAYSGDSCTGTVMAGNYTEPPYGGGTKTSRLISPMFVVPSDNPRLRFYHWYSFNSGDNGRVQIRVNGGDWVTKSSIFSSSSGGWTPLQVPLTDYSDSTVEIGFLITTQRPDYYDGSVAPGWYIDSVVVEPVAPQGPRIECPDVPLMAKICGPEEVCVPLVVHSAKSVVETHGNAVWADNTLCFAADMAGTYIFDIIAANDYGADTCNLSVEVVHDIPLFLNTDNLTFATAEGSSDLPEPKIIDISSLCDDGSLDWELSIIDGASWMEVDKTSGTNPDQVQISLKDSYVPSMIAGTYSGLLKFTTDQSADSVKLVNVSLFIDGGVDIGDYATEPGTKIKVPINLFTNYDLDGFTIPLKIKTSQGDRIFLDSVVLDQNLVPPAIIIDSLNFLVDRPIEPPPLPDSMDAYVLGYAYLNILGTATDEQFLIDTTTIEYAGTTYSYKFVINGQDTIPSFSAGVITVGSAVRWIDIAEVSCEEYDEVDVPVTAAGITNVAGLQLRVNYDETLLAPTGAFVTSSHFNSTINAANGTVSIAWASSSNPITVDSGDVLFTLHFEAIADAGNVAALTWGNGNEIVDPEGHVIAGFILKTGGVSITPRTCDIDGKVVYYDLTTPVADMEIRIADGTTATTNSQGEYCFDDIEHNEYKILAVAWDNTSGVSVADAVMIQRYLARLESFEPYIKIAADIDCNDAINIIDVVKLLRIIVGLDPFPCGNWKTIDAQFAVNNDNWINAPESIMVQYDGTPLIDNNFIGIKVGDVNNSFDPYKGAVAKRGLDSFGRADLIILRQQAEDSKHIQIPVMISASGEIAGFELHLKYDESRMTYANCQSELRNNVFSNHDGNKIDIAWADITSSLDGNDNTNVVILDFESTGGQFDESALNVAHVEVVDSNGQPYFAIVSFGETTQTDGGLVPTEFSLSQNYPNPFNPTTRIDLAMPQFSQYEIVIYNVNGQVVKSFSGSDGPGNVTVVWDGTDVSGEPVATGIYFYKAVAGEFTKSCKMVLLK